MAAKKQGLLTTFKNYGAYIQQKGRATADVYLASLGITGDYAKDLHDSFDDRGKLVGDDGKQPSVLSLMAMKNFID